MGIEVKDHNGSPCDAECKIGIWCVAYFKWLRSKHTSKASLLPLWRVQSLASHSTSLLLMQLKKQTLISSKWYVSTLSWLVLTN